MRSPCEEERVTAPSPHAAVAAGRRRGYDRPFDPTKKWLASAIDWRDSGRVSDDEIIDGIRQPGRFDGTVASEEEARRLVRRALPDAVELPRAVAGQPYTGPSPGTRKWFQVHPPEPGVGNDLPHVKYADWTRGKKGQGGSWGHLFFPPAISDSDA
jgi:hypothetical protein